MREVMKKVGVSRIKGGVFCLLVLLLGVPADAQSTRRKVIPSAQPEVVVASEDKDIVNAAEESRARLLAASQTYRQSLERLLVLQTQDVERAQAQVDKNAKLLEMGLIARRQLETSEQELNEVLTKQGETARQIESLDHLVAEVHAAEQLARMPAAPQGVFRASGTLLRFVGASKWAMNDVTKVDAFYRLKFGRPLPISAFGQTETHQRLGFDHREAIDVAIHPDSAEGQELINYLQTQGISFIAIRGAIAGSATGAHIHIGPPSRRSVASQQR